MRHMLNGCSETIGEIQIMPQNPNAEETQNCIVSAKYIIIMKIDGFWHQKLFKTGVARFENR